MLALHGAAPAHGQGGRADLRYVAPLPAAVTYTTIDSIDSSVGGLPVEDVRSTGTISTITELRFAPAADGVAVTAILKQMSGEMNTPMGPMPMDAGEAPPFEFTMGPEGPGPAPTSGPPLRIPGPGADPAALLGSAMGAGRLVALPGRVLAVGESWVDTARVSPDDAQPVDGVVIDMLTVTRGTYVADTVVDGRTLNVLRIASETTATTSGRLREMEITQEMTVSSEETVLWDSELHVPLWRGMVGQTRAESVASGMRMQMSSRLRSISTAEVTR